MLNNVLRFSEIHTSSSYPASEKRYLDTVGAARIGPPVPRSRSFARKTGLLVGMSAVRHANC